MNIDAIALSGLEAAQTQLSVAGQNIANLNTPGYQSERVDTVELSTGGVGVSGITRDAAPASAGGSNVDLSTQVVNLVQAKTLYAANAFVLKTAEETTGTLLDILDSDRRHPN